MYIVWRDCLEYCAICAIFGLMSTTGTLLSVYASSTLFTKLNFLLTIIMSCSFLSHDHNMKVYLSTSHVDLLLFMFARVHACQYYTKWL